MAYGANRDVLVAVTSRQIGPNGQNEGRTTVRRVSERAGHIYGIYGLNGWLPKGRSGPTVVRA